MRSECENKGAQRHFLRKDHHCKTIDCTLRTDADSGFGLLLVFANLAGLPGPNKFGHALCFLCITFFSPHTGMKMGLCIDWYMM